MYTLFLTPHGKVFSDVTIARLETDRYLIGCNSIRDYYWIQEHAADYQVEVRNLSGQLCSIGLWGPRVRDLLSFLEAEVPEIPYFGVGNGYIAEVPVVLMRLSYIGEFGYELLTTPDYGLRLWDLVLAAGHEYGIVPIGRGAFEGLRLEKGFRLYGKDVWAEHDPFDAGLGAFVDLKKTTFFGREELLRHRATASRVKLVCLEILDPEIVLLGGEPVISEEGQTIGFVTSGAFGYSIGRSLAFAWVDSQYANPETIVVVRQFRFKTKARTIEEPAFDPGHTRMRISRISSKECAQGE
jgi:glycine cleavage system aminomethyltransferase T